MRFAILALTAATLAVAGSATAAGRVTDVDYLKAARCKGLATGASVDTASVDAFLKAEGKARNTIVVDMAKTEQEKGRREARNADKKAKVDAELAGACTAYLSGSSNLATR